MWLRNSRLQIVFQISSPKVVWQNLLGNYIKFLVKNPKITRKIAVFTRAAIRSPKIEKILFSRIQPSETLDYESFSKFRPRKWRVRNWLGTPVIGIYSRWNPRKNFYIFQDFLGKKYQFRRKILLKSRFYTNFEGYSFLESIGKIFFKDPSRVAREGGGGRSYSS